MLIAFFRTNQPAALLAAPVLAAGLLGPALWQQPVPEGGLMPIAALVEHVLGGSVLLHAIAGFLLLLLVTAQASVILNDLELMDRRNHLVAFFFPIALAGMGGPGIYDPALLGLPLAVWSLSRTWRVLSTGGALAQLFDAGLLMGLSALCYLPYAFLLVVLFASVSLIRPFSWREYALPLIAMALTFYLAWAVLHLAGDAPWLPLRTIMTPEPHPSALWSSTSNKAFTVLYTVILLVALAAFNTSYARSVMRGKNLRSSFMALALALVLLMVLLSLLKGSFPAVLAALPASIIAGYAFLNPRRGWLAEAGAYALLVLAVWVRWL